MSNQDHAFPLDRYSFLNEGVASLVFAYNALSADDPMTGMVLRVPKFPYRSQEQDNVARQRIRQVFSALFGEEYILTEEPVVISYESLRALLDKSQPSRSLNRYSVFNSDHVIGSGDWPAWMMDNMTVIDAQTLFTAELKPKWGFLPILGQYRTKTVQSFICRHCLYQSLKHSDGRVSEVSTFCPLDFFSSSRARRKSSLSDMLITPQNNFVVFDDRGRPLFDEASRPINNADLVDLVDVVLSNHESLLGRIQHAQQLSRMALGHVAALLPNITEDQWKELNEDPLSHSLVESIRSSPICDIALQDFGPCLRTGKRYMQHLPSIQRPSLPKPQVNNVVDELRKVLLEMTARDISLMITFSPTTSNTPSRTKSRLPIHTAVVNGSFWRYKIAVVDLECKYPKKLPHWCDVDQTMLKHFEKLCALQD
uniref:Inositol-pentakisphosphate 2-kinase n=1 Tax=Spongospora subterranea TaxID=70186 RepID=A0A0H5RNU4_9EUKA|eukprot:CRZ10404.1 hypothetical protein [Spongospora subterranea]